MSITEIVDVITLCQTFPDLPEPQLKRDHILDRIDAIFEEGNKIVVVEGEGLGKTNVLAQFGFRHHDQAALLFVKPTSRWGYDRDLLRFDITNQIHWKLYGEEIASLDSVNDATIKHCALELHRRTRKTREQFYFVVDGISDLSDTHPSVQQAIIDFMPLEYTGFRFLFSGDSERLRPYLPKGLISKPYSLPFFTTEETRQFLAPLGIDNKHIEEIHYICRGMPNNLASIRRILQGVDDIQELLQHLPNRLPELFEIEWKNLDIRNHSQRLLVALLAHESPHYTTDDLARITSLSPDRVSELLEKLSFVSFDHDSRSVSFVSKAFRQFAADRLRGMTQEITDLVIQDLLRNPESVEALNNLPLYFEQAGKYSELLSYLSPEHLTQMIEKSQSLGLVQDKAGLGVIAARKLRRDNDLISLSMQKSALAVLASAEAWRSEVTARVAVKDYEAAINLAQNTVFKEDRLHLLSVIARSKQQQGSEVEQELRDQIQHIYTQLDAANLGEHAVDIAADLIYTFPDLAIELVEKANNTDSTEGALDWAFAKLTLTALIPHEENNSLPDIKDTLNAHIKDPILKRFTEAATRYVKDYSAVEVIKEVEGLDRPSDGLYLLRQWLTANRRREDAASIVAYALRLSIRTTSYVLNARDMRQLASPLPFIKEKKVTFELINLIESQMNTLSEVGPTEDYVRLMLLIAEAAINHELETGRKKLAEIYFYIIELPELDIRTSCMAWLVTALTSIDPDSKLESLDKIHSSSEGDFKLYLRQLLDATADHFEAVRDVISALACSRSEIAFEIAIQLNAVPRRDAALDHIIDVMIKGQNSKLDVKFIQKILLHFDDMDLKDDALVKIIDAMSKFKHQTENHKSEIMRLISDLDKIRDSGQRCSGYCHAIILLHKWDSLTYKSLIDSLVNRIELVWQNIDVGWHKISVAFKIASLLASSFLVYAQSYITKAVDLRNSIALDTESTAGAHIDTIKLAIRAFSGLLPRHHDTSKELNILTEMIERIPSYGERALLWADLALYYAIHKRTEECRKIVSQHVRPLLDNIPIEDGFYRAQIISSISPALYIGHKITAFDRIESLSQYDKDVSYWNICIFLFRNRPPSDPYDYWGRQGFNISYEAIIDICELINRIDVDIWIYMAVEYIADTIIVQKRKHQITRSQIADIVGRLENIVNTKLPNPKYIIHDGWKIAAQAQLERVKATRGDVWRKYIQEARAISNIADRLFVLSHIAIAMPDKECSRREQLYEEVAQQISLIPMTKDRITRYEMLAHCASDNHVNLSRKYLRYAMQEAVGARSSGNFAHQRRIIDAAYRIDPDLAASLVLMADTDPARDNAQRQIQILKMKQEVTGKNFTDLQDNNKEDYILTAWRLLGALNSERVSHVHFDRARKFTEVASELPLPEAYPILAWVIQNAVSRLAHTDQAFTVLRSIFEATCLAAELSARVAIRSSLQSRQALYIRKSTVPDSKIVFGAGEREQAIQYLYNWFEQNVSSYLKICDEYFGPDDIEVLKLLNAIKPDCKVSILTSQKWHNDQHITQPAETYRERWRQLSDQEPPETEIVIVGITSTKKSPIHDRWWITEKAGLSIGTSYNSFGRTQESKITPLNHIELRQLEDSVDSYLQRKREYNGERLEYTIVIL